MIALRVTQRPGAAEPDATALALPAEGLVIGRADDCGLVLADPLRLVSRQHAQVMAEGDTARVRCISSSTPLWVNDAQLDPGADRALGVGDRLRIGRFELVVEPAAAEAASRSRLDRWFDLDGAPSPAPPLALEVPQVAPPIAPPTPAAVPADPPASAAPAPRKATRRSPDLADGRELAAAFARGAGLRADAVQLTPEAMEHLGTLLRAWAEGTLALLQSRAVAKRHMRAEGTQIAPRHNNPLKFAPDATEALTRMLQREGSPGFLDPVAALRDAHRDLLVHQVAMVAGMRAAVFELFSRLSPEAAENAEGPAHGLSRVPGVRAAALWERHCQQHAQLLEHLDDDFETIFGREFLRAYEAQSRADADPNLPPP
jgi:predicted component of type VI protein secretion system